MSKNEKSYELKNIQLTTYAYFDFQAFVFVIFWYQMINGWSAAVMIEDMYLMVFNLLFTSLPPMAIGTRQIEENLYE